MRSSAVLVVALVGCVLGLALPVAALERPLYRVEAAIRIAAPKLPPALVKVYAKPIRRDAIKYRYCPLTQISLVKFESGFRAGLVAHTRRRGVSLPCTKSTPCYVGLGQISAFHRPECKAGGWESPGCQKRVSELKDGVYNLGRTALGIHLNRQVCRRITGQPALFARWLSSYGGFNNSAGRRGVWCNMKKDRRGRWRDVPAPAATRRVMAYRRELIRRVR